VKTAVRKPAEVVHERFSRAVVHALLIPRAGFRKIVEGSLRNSFVHSFLAKGRVL
jgi:hypothetical protein